MHVPNGIDANSFPHSHLHPHLRSRWPRRLYQAIYDMPELDADLKEEMIQNPWETQSDSFYYVGDDMILHNKAK